MAKPGCECPTGFSGSRSIRRRYRSRDFSARPTLSSRDRYRLLIERDPENPVGHFNLGLAFYHLGQLEEAIIEFQRTVALDETFASAYFQLATCYYRRGMAAECIEACQKALQYNPAAVPAKYRLAQSLFHLGRLHEALETFADVVKGDPGYV